MADRYWVGGSDTWDATAGTKWATTSGGAGGSAVPTSADDVYIDSGSGVVTVTVAATAVCLSLKFVSGAGSFAGTFAGSSALSFSGDFVASASMTWTYTGALTAASTTAQTLTSNGKALDCPITFNGVAGSWALQDALTTGSTRTVTLTNGSLDLNGFNLTAGAFSSSNTNVRSITSGAGQFYCTGTSATVWTTSTITNLTMVDRPTINVTGASGSPIMTLGNLGESVVPTVNISTGAGTFGWDGRAYTLNFTGFSGTYTNPGSRTIYGNLTLSTTMTAGAGTTGTTFAATSGTQVITSNGVTLDFPITVAAVGGTVRLADALTSGSTRTFTLTNGSLDLNGFNLTAGAFSSSNTNVRSITSGVGQFYLTAASSSVNDVVVSLNTITNLTLVDRPTFNLSGNGSGTAIRQAGLGAFAEAVAPDINVTAGTDTAQIPSNSGGVARSINFTGFSGTWAVATRTIYGNLTASATMTPAAGSNTTTFAATSGTQIVTSNGVTLDFPVTVNAPGATVQLADALTMAASRALTLTGGTFDANNKNVTTGNFSAGAGATTRVTSMGTGTWTILDASVTAWNTPSAASHTVTPSTSTVLMTAATAKTFVGGGRTFWNLYNGGLGALTVTGANTFNDLQTASPRYWVGGSASWDATAGTKWSLTSGGAGGEAVPTSADDVYIDSGSGAVTVTVAATAACLSLKFVSGAGSFAGTFAGSSALSFSGDFVASASMTWTYSGTLTAAATTAQTVTSNGKALDCSITFNGVAGSWALQDALTTGSTRDFTLTNGSLDLNGFNLTAGAFSSSNTNVRSITSGAGQFYITGTSGTVWSTSTVTNLTMVDRPTINVTGAPTTGTRTLNLGALAENRVPTVNISAGTATLGWDGSAYTMDFTGYAGTLSNPGSRTVYGNLTYSATMTPAAGVTGTTFAATSGTQVITSNGVTLDFPITVAAVGATVQLADALTLGSTRTFTLTNGSLDLNGFNLTAGAFSSSNTNVRSITSGAGQFYLTAASSSVNDVVVSLNTITNLTLVDRPTFNLSGNGSGTAIRQAGLGAFAEAVAPDINVTAGTDTAQIPSNSGGVARSINFTGFSGTWANATRTIYGSPTLSPTMTATAGTLTTTFAATSGTQVITSNGVTLDFPITKSGAGALQLADALTMGAGRALTLTAGTFDANNKNVTTGNFTAGAGATTRVTSMGTGTWTILDAGATAWSTPAAASHTVTPSTSTILMTAATAKTFAGGGRTFWNLSNGGAGALSITGANMFDDLQNTVTPATFTLPASTTTTVSALSLQGTSGNLVTLDSSTPATRATLSKASGTVDVSYLSIKDSAATGGATFLAVPDNGNIDAGNNTGWKFSFIDVDVSGVEALGLIAQALVWALVDDGNTVTWVEIPT